MYWSKTFIPTLKEAPQEAESFGHQLMLRAGMVRMLMAGVYSYLPLGWKVLNNIEQIIRQEMDAVGGCEVLLPALQPLELWQRSGRDKDIADVMIRFVDRRGRKICLGPTHEEVITELVKSHVSSYRQLPVVLYQIQTKFRDELRPRFGLVRGCEFIMKDAYSFDVDNAGLDKNYASMLAAYQKIFTRCGLDFLTLEADPGVMGGSVSHEFMVPAADGEDVVFYCAKCKGAYPFSRSDIEAEAGSRRRAENKAAGAEGRPATCPKCKEGLEKITTLEIGHIFKLGTKYSKSLGANFVDAQGKLQPIIMGCYGIGVSRMISAIIERNHDENGIIWPRQIAPYQLIILPLEVGDVKIMQAAQNLYQELQIGLDTVLFDDRDERAGVKFKDADLLGIPLQAVVGKEFLKNGTIELKKRGEKEKISAQPQEILKKVKAEIG